MDQFRQAEISPINKRSIEIDGHRTSVSLEDAFWAELKKIAAIRNVRTAELIATINRAESTLIFRQLSAYSCSITIASRRTMICTTPLMARLGG
jgi:predicted DNA-binding ribbon-helix-helix protein